MSKTKFQYNPKTLRYERVRLSVLNIALTVFSYLSFGALFFVGLVLLENYFFETPLEESLRKENATLRFYKSRLVEDLGNSTQKLEKLKKQESALYNSLFETGKPHESIPKIHREEILLANTSEFFTWSKSIEDKFKEINKRATQTNFLFSLNTHVSKTDLNELYQVPSVPPVENFKVEQLVSGFGTRINPFHKGLYHHDGLDIAAPTGSNVVAAGSGKIISANNSAMVGGYGNYIEIDHGNGLISRYAHLGELKVRMGQKINKGQVIALVGVSGGSVAPHVHYEVMKNGTFLNPIKFMIANLTSAQYESLVSISSNQNQSLD